MEGLEAKVAESGDLEEVARLFGLHVHEQAGVGDEIQYLNEAFNPLNFIKAEFKAGTSLFIIVMKNGRAIGFARLYLRSGDSIIPWRAPDVNRLSIAYIKRFPFTFLTKLSLWINRLKVWLSGINIGEAQMFNPVRFGYLADIYVERDMRKSGVGKALMERAMTAFNMSEVEFVSLNVMDANQAGRAFWKSLGFKDQNITMLKKQPRQKLS